MERGMDGFFLSLFFFFLGSIEQVMKISLEIKYRLGLGRYLR